LDKKTSWHLLGSLQENAENEIELPDKLTRDPYNLEAVDNSKGFQLLAVTGGTLNSDATDTARRRVCVDVKPETGQKKFSLDVLADMYKGSYMIVVASYQDTKTPVYVKLRKSDQDANPWFDEDVISTLLNDTEIIDRTYKNPVGTMTIETDEETNRRYFKAQGLVSNTTPLIMLKLASKDFAHMIPEGATTAESADKIFYGPTNYAVYIDVSTSKKQTGGFLISLNGSEVTSSGGYSNSVAYVLQSTFNLNGFSIPYYGGGGNVWRGARPMYFYDAAKENSFAPGGILFKAATGDGADTENFNENAGAMPDANLSYRLPFSTSAGYADRILTEFPTDLQDKRNDFSVHMYNIYGTMAGMTFSRTIYSPKHMQSWHNYKYPEEVTENDDRIGFRWDRSWYIYASDSGGQRDLWEQRKIIKLTILEATRAIRVNEVDPEWGKYKIHHDGEASVPVNSLTTLNDNAVIHAPGDMFVRVELIQLQKGATDWNNSRYYVYSKPIWFGKFKGDAWRGDDPSPLKKLGNAMQHIVADPEPAGGNAQSFRRRGMRVRSWKEAFLGWDFTRVKKDSDGRYRYVWRDFVNKSEPGSAKDYNERDPFGSVSGDTGTKKMPPDFFETVYGANGRIDASPGKTRTAHSVWTPPTAIDMNGHKTDQSGGYSSGFGQYTYGQSVGGALKEDGVMVYSGDYGDKIYGRLSVLRPWRGDENSELPNQTTPIFGLYAMRGWDFGTSRLDGVVTDSTGYTPKRFLRVVQGLQLPYQPSGVTRPKYEADRARILGFIFAQIGDNYAGTYINIYDAWIGEGFSPREVRAILGLKEGTDDATTRGTYVYSNKDDPLGGSDLEKAGYYMPYMP
jgi:hypothetical protein